VDILRLLPIANFPMKPNKFACRLGVTQDHIDASVASGKPIRVPLTNVINMAQSPHWDSIASEITENGLPKTGLRRRR